MGMHYVATDSPAQLPFNQTDTCATLHAINIFTKRKLNAVDGRRQMHSDILRQDLSMHKGRKVVICTQIT